MTNVERVLALIRSSPGGLTDREIRERTGISPHQQVNQIGNRLAREGLTRREPDARGVLVNKPAVEDERDPSVPAVPLARERGEGTSAQLEIDLASALVVIPCSGGKRRGGADRLNGDSILEFLPEELADELRMVRLRNSLRCKVDESLWMPAVQRYCGTLYEYAGATLERLRGSVAGLAIISGGYGVVLADEPIGWYEQRFKPAMWPDGLVARSLSAYAKEIGAGTVVGMFGATTPYAKAFRRTKWPSEIQDGWLVSPQALARDGALRKVPSAIGEALVVIGSGGALSADWRSSDGLAARVTRIADGVSGNLEETAGLAEEVAGDFYEGRFDLTARGETLTSAWSTMPEVEVARELRRSGALERSIRRFLTFVSAMDRARDAFRLWRAGGALFQRHPEVFDPAVVSSMTTVGLSGLLAAAGVSQRHGPDSKAWWTIGRSLAGGNGAVCRVVAHGNGDAVELLADLRSVDSTGRARFPMLKGPKVGPMWVRILANPGAARVRRIEEVPVAVDTHVRRATRNLGVADGNLEGAKGKRIVQSAWRQAVMAGNVGGPSRIAGTSAALDPALCFFGKYGCSHCEENGRRVPIGRACRACKFSPN